MTEKPTFISKCVLRRQTIPILPCDVHRCEWWIKDSSFNNCFWVLANYLEDCPGTKFTFEHIAEVESLPLSDVISTYESALHKLRIGSRKIVKSESIDNIS